MYGRVSSANQKNDLASQKEALEKFCIAAGKPIGLWLQDIGSGLNYKTSEYYMYFHQLIIILSDICQLFSRSFK